MSGHSLIYTDGGYRRSNFQFLLNNFARLTNIISEECPTFSLFSSVFRLHLLYVIFKLCGLKVKGLENFQAFVFCLKLRVNGGMLRFSIAFIETIVKEIISKWPQSKAFEASFV